MVRKSWIELHGPDKYKSHLFLIIFLIGRVSKESHKAWPLRGNIPPLKKLFNNGKLRKGVFYFPQPPICESRWGVGVGFSLFSAKNSSKNLTELVRHAPDGPSAAKLAAASPKH